METQNEKILDPSDETSTCQQNDSLTRTLECHLIFSRQTKNWLNTGNKMLLPIAALHPRLDSEDSPTKNAAVMWLLFPEYFYFILWAWSVKSPQRLMRSQTSYDLIRIKHGEVSWSSLLWHQLSAVWGFLSDPKEPAWASAWWRGPPPWTYPPSSVAEGAEPKLHM